MGAEIEITPEMIKAGLEAYWAWDKSDDYSIERLVTSVFRAMSQPVQYPPSQRS